jgi:hypothetical protein
MWTLLAGVLVVGSACKRAEPVQPEPALLNTATIKDIMDSMVDPSADFLFESVQTVADEKGVREIAPQTNEEWQEVRRRAMILLEAPNLLIMNGRAVANPGDKSANPAIELEPAQIQALIDGDRPAFIERARLLQDAGMLALKAADARNKDALFAASERIDKACENCHLKYWYPNDQRAQEAARQNP